MKRGTRANLDAAALAGTLVAGEPYLITDEDRIAVGLTAGTYQDYSKVGEGGGGLTPSASTVTTSDVSGVVGTLHALDVSGMTEARIFMPPSTAEVGDRVGVLLTTDAPATHGIELIVEAPTGHTINGTSGERTRMFISGESLEFLFVAANTWAITNDGRIPCVAKLRLSTPTGTMPAITTVYPTAYGGAWTSDVDVGGITTASTGAITARRAGKLLLIENFYTQTNIPLGGYGNIYAQRDGVTGSSDVTVSMLSASNSNWLSGASSGIVFADVGTYWRMQWRSSSGAQLLGGAASSTTFKVVEVLT